MKLKFIIACACIAILAVFTVGCVKKKPSGARAEKLRLQELQSTTERVNRVIDGFSYVKNMRTKIPTCFIYSNETRSELFILIPCDSIQSDQLIVVK